MPKPPNFKRADAAIEAFLADAHIAEEKIINRALPEPNDDPQIRILKRFTRDMQLIIIQSAAELARLPETDSLSRTVVLLAKCLLQGVAAITSPLTDNDEEAVEYFLRYFAKEIDRTHDKDEDAEE